MLVVLESQANWARPDCDIPFGTISIRVKYLQQYRFRQGLYPECNVALLYLARNQSELILELLELSKPISSCLIIIIG